MSYLPEVPEAEAGGTVAKTYAEIRRVIGLPFVMLVYRHLAVEHGRLEAVWRELAPNLADVAVDEAAAELASVAGLPTPRLSRATLGAIGVGADELTLAAATLEGYAHANPRNLVAVLALLEGTSGGARPRPRTFEHPPAATILPLARLDSLAPSLRPFLDEIAAPFTGPGDDLLVPGLFRHFCHRPALLALLWVVLLPEIETGRLEARARAVTERARAFAAGLPHPVGRLEGAPATRAALERFVFTIGRMTVAAQALRSSLPDV